jgi:hypothetical protein
MLGFSREIWYYKTVNMEELSEIDGNMEELSEIDGKWEIQD